MMPRLAAEEQIRAIEASLAAWMSPEDRRTMVGALLAAADPDSRAARDSGPAGPTEGILAARVALSGIGVQIVKGEG